MVDNKWEICPCFQLEIVKKIIPCLFTKGTLCNEWSKLTQYKRSCKSFEIINSTIIQINITTLRDHNTWQKAQVRIILDVWSWRMSWVFIGGEGLKSLVGEQWPKLCMSMACLLNRLERARVLEKVKDWSLCLSAQDSPPPFNLCAAVRAICKEVKIY